MKKEYYIVIWKDHEGKIHRNEHHYGGKRMALYIHSDISIRIPHFRPSIEQRPDGTIVLCPKYTKQEPLMTVLYIFTVKPT